MTAASALHCRSLANDTARWLQSSSCSCGVRSSVSVLRRMVEMFDDLRSARENEPPRKPPPQKKKTPETIRHQLRGFAPWINQFGCSIFRKLATGAEGGNVAAATGSLFVLIGALSQESTSAVEDTEEMSEALFGRAFSNLDKLAKEMAKVSDDQASYKWQVISGLYVPNDRRLDKVVVAKLEDKFGVKVHKMPATKDTRQLIETVNQFYREESDQRLTDMIPTEQSNMHKYVNSMIATVGVYVHPWWWSRFDRNKTIDELFHETKDKQYRVSMMRRESMMPYVQSELCPGVVVRVAGIPCRGHGATVYFVVPVKRFELDEVVSHLTGDRAARLIGYCRPRRVRASIPKLHASFSTELRRTFAAHGVDAWLNINHPAIFGIVKRGACLSMGQIYHQVVIKLNEDGDQAAGDAVVDPREPATDFRCDQPFVILFHHTATNAVWMLAEVKQPSVQGPRSPSTSSTTETE